MNWKQINTLCNSKKNDLPIQPQTKENTMHIQTKEAHYATSNKGSTLCNCKQMKHIMHPQTYEEH